MRKKPSYEDLQQKVNALEKQVIECKETATGFPKKCHIDKRIDMFLAETEGF